ncbi:YbaN family protein [Roseiflexus sp.]|uniref:YbaN family protein n=1 Tax=Roseiflexus sp. TaxID=2562120 RepID=UPI00398AFC32
MTSQEQNISPKLNPVTRAVLIIIGTITLGIGILGMFLPGLPTTPFLLVTAACYMRSSERLYGWLIGHPRLSPHIERFNRERSMTLQAKLVILALAWTMLIGAAIFLVESLFMRVFLVVLAIIKTIVFARIKTASG